MEWYQVLGVFILGHGAGMVTAVLLRELFGVK